MAFIARAGSRFGSHGRALAGVAGLTGMGLAWHQQRQAHTEAGSFLSTSEFSSVKCIGNEQHTHDTRKISFAPVDDNEASKSWNPVGPIANVLIRFGGPAATSKCCSCCKCGADCGCPIGAHGCCSCCGCTGTCGCAKPTAADSKSVTRNYNPISPPETGYYGSSFTVLVKKYPEGKMGTALHNLSVGDVVEAKGPNVQFGINKGQYSTYGMIAGGTGLTPMIQATRYILHYDTAKISLLCFNKTEDDVLLKEDLECLQKAFPDRLKVTHVVENSDGKVSGPLLKDLLPAPAPGVMVLCCGRGEMTAAVAGPKAKDWTQGDIGGLLKELGYSKEQVWKV